MRTNAAMTQHPNPDSSGGRLVSVDGRALPLRGAHLRADARAGIARVTLEQRFANPYDEPLAVTYLLPLPADGAVSAFAFTIGDKRIVGEIDRRQAARERFEEAIAEGRSAALVEQERSSLFTQEIGNIPPHAEVVAELVIDQKLAWLDEGAWEWRFPTVVVPRYQGAAGRVGDAGRAAVDVADGALPARARLALTIRDGLAAGRAPESPSHALHRDADGGVQLAAEDGAALDRDLVVRGAVAAPAPGLTLDTGCPAANQPHAEKAYGLLTLVPPARGRAERPVTRDLCLLIDTSGSMSGEPLDQARKVLLVLVDTLGDEDRLEMIEFSSQPRRWKRAPVAATRATRAEARTWLDGLSAGGGTEMRDGILEALSPLRAEAQRQIVIVTDGGISFEQEIVAEILRRMPASCRVHTVGVGSGVNRSLTRPAARAGRGAEIIIGLGEDPERAARRLVACTDAPLVVDLSVEGAALRGHAPAKLPDLYAGAPALVSLALSPEGGPLTVRGRTRDGEWRQQLTVPATAAGAGSAAVAALYGREAVEDLETRLCAGEPAAEIDRAVEKLGLEFQIATRLTSWVAIAQEASVDPKEPSRKVRMPHQLPFGMSAAGLGLMPLQKGAFTGRVGAAAPMRTRMAMPAAPAAFGAAGGAGAADAKKRAGGIMSTLGRMFDRAAKSEAAPSEKSAAEPPRQARDQDDEQRARAVTLGEGAAAAEEAPPPRVRGRIVRKKGREWIVEIEVQDELDWTPSDDAVIEDEDGAATAATVDRARTTRAGTLGAGQVVRLVLTLAGDVDAARTIACGGLTIEVQ